MAGASGTNNQINNDINGLLAEDATQLRGLFDKESDIVDYASLYPPPPAPPVSLFQSIPLDRVPATGWGFGNTGSFADTVTNFVNLGVFHTQQLTPTDRANIVVFLGELDTGTPPAAAYAWTLNAASAATPVANHPFTTLLQGQATRSVPGSNINDSNIDLVVRGWMVVGATPKNIGMKYNDVTGKFETDTTGVGPFSYANLVTTVTSNRGAFLLMGTPRGSGYRLGLDSEMDFALDGDELAAGAVVGVADTDGDRFPDGYEMSHGSNPASAASLPPPDITAPTFPPPGSPTLAWKSANTPRCAGRPLRKGRAASRSGWREPHRPRRRSWSRRTCNSRKSTSWWYAACRRGRAMTCTSSPRIRPSPAIRGPASSPTSRSRASTSSPPTSRRRR